MADHFAVTVFVNVLTEIIDSAVIGLSDLVKCHLRQLVVLEFAVFNCQRLDRLMMNLKGPAPLGSDGALDPLAPALEDVLF